MSHHDGPSDLPALDLRALRYGSLFSGIDGIGLAADRVGMQCTFQVEKLAHLRTGPLARHWPDVPKFDDVATVTKEKLGDAARIDVLVGGFPCQDLSVAGGRRGLAGERSFLWWHFARLVAELAPRWVLVENVDGLLSSNGGRDMGTVLGTLGDLGYGFAARVLDAQWFGVGQRRRRLLIVGCAGHWTGAAEVLLEPETGGGHPREVDEKEARAALRAGRRPRSRRRGRAGGVLADDDIASSLTTGLGSGGPDAAHAHAGWYVVEEHDLAPALLSRGGRAPGTGRDDDGHLVTEVLDDGVRDTAHALRAGSSSPGVNPPGWHGEWDTNLVPEAVVPLALRGRDGDTMIESGEPDDPMYALRAGDGGSSRAPLVGVFRKAKRASTNTDDETWEEDDLSNTLTPFDSGGTRTTTAIVEAIPVDVRNASRTGGNGTGTAGVGIGEDGDPAYTLTQNPAAQAVAYSVAPERGQGGDLVLTETEIAQTLTVKNLGNSGDRQPLILQREGGSLPMSQRVATGDVLPTLTSSASPNRGGTQGPLVLDGAELVVRRLLPVECLRLQGFPDDWCGEHDENWNRPDGLADSPTYQAAGNSVAVPLFHWALRRLVLAHARLDLDQLPAPEPQAFTVPEFVALTDVEQAEVDAAEALAAEPPPSLF